MLEDEQEKKEWLHEDRLLQVRHVESMSTEVVGAIERLLHECP